MVEFTNVRVEGDWIYADAYDRDFKVSGHIKVHKTEELFETNCKETNQFQKAAWHLVKEVQKGRTKNGTCTIAWG